MTSKDNSGQAESFVLTFDEVMDPTPEQTAEALQHLQSFEAKELFPGTIQVVGQADDVTKAAEILQEKRWNLSREQVLSSDPPHKSFIK